MTDPKEVWVAPSSYYDSIGVVRGNVTRRKERRLRVKRNAYRRKAGLYKYRESPVYQLLEQHYTTCVRLHQAWKVTAVFHAEPSVRVCGTAD